MTFRVPPFDLHKHREEYRAANEVTTRISVTAFYRNIVVAYTRRLKVSEGVAPTQAGPPPSDAAQSGPTLLRVDRSDEFGTDWPES